MAIVTFILTVFVGTVTLNYFALGKIAPPIDVIIAIAVADDSAE